MNTGDFQLPGDRGRLPDDRIAGFIQGLLLMLGSCLPVMGAVLIAPVLPRIVSHFAHVPNVALWAPLALTAPALMVGLTAPFAGAIVDRLGRKRLLLFALVLYAVTGLAPLWLESLHRIVASRVAMGVAEAAIMTCCTTLIGDYFDGARRARYLAQQTIWASMSATVFFAVGGLMGEAGWRTPFWVYAAAFFLLPMMAFYLWEPVRSAAARTEREAPGSAAFPWKPMTLICVLTLLGAIAFYLLPVHLGFVLEARGYASPRLIGLAMGIGSLATVLGAFLFRYLARRGVPALLAISYATLGLGFVLVARAQTYNEIVAGMVVSGFGAGIILPSLVTWMMAKLSFEHRGRGTGAFLASFFIGQFICPVVVLGLGRVAGGLLGSVEVFGWTFLGLAVFAAGISLSRCFVPQGSNAAIHKEEAA